MECPFYRGIQGINLILTYSVRKDDPEAVTIAKPVTRHSSMFGQVGFNLLGEFLRY